MAMPSQYSKLLLILLAATIVAAYAEEQPRTIPAQLCPEKCGDVSIPFPFGMTPGCFRDARFKVICNDSFNPHRAFLPHPSAFREIGHAKYSAFYPEMYAYPPESDNSPQSPVQSPESPLKPLKLKPVFTDSVETYSTAPVELLDISPNRSELRVYSWVTSDCVNRGVVDGERDHRVITQGTSLSNTSFCMSVPRNALVGVGSNAVAQFFLSIQDDRMFPLLSCVSNVNIDLKNGSCTGMGCCQASFSPRPRTNDYCFDSFSAILAQRIEFPLDYDYNPTPDSDYIPTPCTYGMVVDTSWYNFSTEDINGHELSNKHPRGVPVVLEFAIRRGNHSCPAEGQKQPEGYACISGNSSCAKPPSGDGYICKCWDNYEGNPYIEHGCQDIDECGRRLHNCSVGSKCNNTPGGYECPCKRGTRGDGKKGPCKEILPLPAMVAVGIAVLIAAIALGVMAHQILKLKRFYKQNGGPILEGVKNIRIYTSNQLKKMTNNYNVVLGEGHFGKVYMGTLKDKEEVAVKKTIKVDEGSKKDFIDEVIIQSGMRHKNIVRLLGCCLEMDVPMLMYEYVVKGSLYDVLFKSKANIPVDTRLRIAIGSAEGLAYMHSAGENTIRHGDVKSANILLDESFTPKISDFGTSKLLARGNSEKTEWVTGDKAYIDPAYMVHGILTQKSDVYSFGIVLIELITRRVAKYDDNMSYVKNFVQACQDQSARNFFDNDITSEKDIELLLMVSEVALECLKLDPEERLDMRQVENRLYIIGQSEQCGQERNFQGNLSPNYMEVPFLKSVESNSSAN